MATSNTSADHVRRRNFLRWIQKNVKANEEIQFDTVANVWEDPHDGRKVITAGGHIVESSRRIRGDTIRLARRGLVWMEV